MLDTTAALQIQVPAAVAISRLLNFASSSFILPSVHTSAIPSTATTRTAMQPSLTWAIWALFIPLSVAERVARQVNWVDLMTATSKFPRFFGEPAEVNRTGPPQVVALTNATDGRTERMKCSRSTSKAFDCVFDCESCMPSIKKDVLGVIELLQEGHQAAWNNLTFIADRWTRHSEWIDKEEQPFQTVFFNQTNLGGEIEIDNTMNRLVKPLVSRWPGSLHTSPMFVLREPSDLAIVDFRFSLSDGI